MVPASAASVVDASCVGPIRSTSAPGRASAAGDVGDIERRRDPSRPGRRSEPAAAETGAARDCSRSAKIAVGIADRDRGEPRRPRSCDASHRSQRSPRCQRRGPAGFSLAVERLGASDWAGPASGVDAVERGARADQVEMEIGPRKMPRRGGEAGAARRRAERAQRGAEAVALLARSADASGSSAQARWLMTSRQRAAPSSARARRPAPSNSSRRQAEARHAGIEMQRRRRARRRGAAASRRSAPRLVEHGHQPMRGECRRAARQRGRSAHRCRGVGQQRARSATPSSSVATKKLPAAGRRERRRHLRHAQAVGVGLDHGARTRPAPPSRRQQALVGDDGARDRCRGWRRARAQPNRGMRPPIRVGR